MGLREGYPLLSLEKMKEEGVELDVALFVRTAVKLNNKELREYLSVLSDISKSIIFLEPAKLSFNIESSVDIRKIDKYKSLNFAAINYCFFSKISFSNPIIDVVLSMFHF